MTSEAAHMTIGIDEVEQIAALGWRGLEEETLGRWLLRAADGFTGRSNSVLAVGEPPTPDSSWVGEVARWYADRGLPAMAQIPLGSSDRVDVVLADAGWQIHDLVAFLTGDIAAVRRVAASPSAVSSEGRPVANLLAEGVPHSNGIPVVARLEPEPDDGWLSTYYYRGEPLPAHAREVIRRAGEDTHLCFASLRSADPDGGVLAVARGALGAGWLGITAVTVSAEHRNRGLATRLMQELTNWAAEMGGHSIYLQVAADNVPALTLYDRLGFHRHHDYRYRVGPKSQVSAAP